MELVFDGAAVAWIPELEHPDHKLHKVFLAVKDRVAGACEFCAGAFGVKDEVRAAGIDFPSEYEGHPSLRRRVAEEYEIVTF